MEGPPAGDHQGASDGVSSASFAVVMFVFLAGGVMVLISVVIIMSGLLVAAQWPHPAFCCWSRPYSDSCGRNRCFHLHQANMLMALVWLVMHIFILFTRIWQLTVLVFLLALLHCASSLFLYRKFESHGWPQTAVSSAVQMSATHPMAPVVRAASIPFLTAYVLGSTEDEGHAAGEGSFMVDQGIEALEPASTPPLPPLPPLPAPCPA